MIQAHSESLPDIEAHQFKIMPLEKSRTGRVYRFKVDAEQLPKTGNILLIEENDKPTMAFRVLNTDPMNGQFVAKRVRRYDTSSELKLNERYQTVEKISDLVPPPPPEPGTYNPNAKPLLDPDPVAKTSKAADPAPTPAPQKSMDVEKYDEDLDSSTSPVVKEKPTAKVDETDSKESVDEEALDPAELGLDLEVKEQTLINPYRFAAGISVGNYKNLSNFIFNGSTAGGTSAFFSHVIERNLFFRKKVPQDSLSMEYGLSYYNLNNVNGRNDDYTLVPLRVDLRYDVHVSESFTPFFYVGIQYNWIQATQNVDTTKNAQDLTTYETTRGFGLDLGIGVFYNIGPQWYLRGDLGVDRLAVGLAVKW